MSSLAVGNYFENHYHETIKQCQISQDRVGIRSNERAIVQSDLRKVPDVRNTTQIMVIKCRMLNENHCAKIKTRFPIIC